MRSKLFLLLVLLFYVLKPSYCQPLSGKTDTIIIKFKEGSYVRQKKGTRFFNLGIVVPKMAKENKKADANLLYYQLMQVKNTFDRYGTYSENRLFTDSEKFYDDQKMYIDSLNESDEDIADFNLYYQFIIRYNSGKTLQNLLEELKANNEIIKNAYPLYHAVNAGYIRTEKKATAVGDYTGQQNYLQPSPLGVDARFGWNQKGGLGDGITVVDIEKNWNDKHSDLSAASISRRGNSKNSDDSAHGTAVLGEMFAKHNGLGIDGIVPNAKYGIIAVNENEPVSKAILKAIKVLKRGDIMLIEQHAPGPPSGRNSNCNHEQFEFMPMEYWEDVYDAIRAATAKGIIVVEAAGNGQMNLDDSIYHDFFNRKKFNSGAILVAADGGGNGTPACLTNYGSRIDFYAWGDSVTTLGYGDLNNLGMNDDSSYTEIFSGTSSAVPIVAGAIACIQAVRKANKKSLWTSQDFINNMQGTPQIPATLDKYIGRLPDVRRTIVEMK